MDFRVNEREIEGKKKFHFHLFFPIQLHIFSNSDLSLLFCNIFASQLGGANCSFNAVVFDNLIILYSAYLNNKILKEILAQMLSLNIELPLIGPNWGKKYC